MAWSPDAGSTPSTPAPPPAATSPTAAPSATPTAPTPPSGPPGSSAGLFHDVGANIDQQGAAALAALATGGTQGLAAHQAALAALNSDRAAAVKAQLDAVRSLGAPQASVPQLQSTLTGPYDQFAATGNLLMQAQERAAADRQAAAENYFAEAKGALPIVRAAAEARLVAMQQAAQQKAQQDAVAQQDANLRLQIDQTELAKAQKPQTPGDVINALGGDKLAGAAISAAAQQQLQREQQESQRNASLGAGTGPSGQGGGNFTPGPDTPDAVAQQLGLAPGQGTLLTTPPAATTPSAAKVRNDPSYPAALSHAQQVLAANPDEIAAVNQLVREGMQPGVAYQVVSDAAARMTSAGGTP